MSAQKKPRHILRPNQAIAAAEHVLSETTLRQIADKVFKLSDADETEVHLDVTSDALTRFANNAIHQNVAEQMLTISIRTVYDGRTARATTNKMDDESIRRAVLASGRIARSQPKNPRLLPMPGPQKYAKVERFSKTTAAATPADRARAVRGVCALAEGKGQTAAGIFATGAMQNAIANSKGLFASYQQTRAEFSVTMLEKDSSGWAKANAASIEAIDPRALAARATEKCASSRAPRKIEPGKHTVILEPAAVLDLVGFLFYDFAATAVQDQRSCFNKRMGKQVVGRNVSLWDDFSHPLQLGAPFDGEGMPRQRVLLIDRGVPKNLVYSRATAKQMNKRPTGHGFALPNEWGEAPMNLVFMGGEHSVQEMISSTERGILVTRLWYIREVEPYEKVLTGMTRDGTFLVEKGRISGGIRNLRFNQSVLEMLASIEMLGPAVRATGEESFEMVVPAMKIRNFHFTEVTKF
ncbi:MAG TPA: TldD/PmbA family protein [Candidatus Dormibacteraeota bacterium]|nr:TldD/PmbA family protein [Candidatus Dormibacteraeota bacterium]